MFFINLWRQAAVLWAGAMSLAASSGSLAGTDPSMACESAIETAAAEYGVPIRVLAAVARVESGRTVSGRYIPWPWTLNVAGQGASYPTRQQAEAAVARATEAGEQSIDIGCFQINTRWHGAAFTSADAMLDPMANARYAARFLSRLFTQEQDWTLAAGRFHSQTPDHAAAYRAKYSTVLAQLDLGGPQTTQTTPQTKPRRNNYPLLTNRADSVTSHGSLVPILRRPGRTQSLIGG